MTEAKRPINAVLVENDHLLREYVKGNLEAGGVVVEDLGTEHGFRSRLPWWRENKPDVFILGTRVRWTDADDNIPEPTKDVIEEGYFVRAGLRMQRYLAQDPSLSGIPVILHGLEVADQYFSPEPHTPLPQGVIFVDWDNNRKIVDVIQGLVNPTR